MILISVFISENDGFNLSFHQKATRFHWSFLRIVYSLVSFFPSLCFSSSPSFCCLDWFCSFLCPLRHKARLWFCFSLISYCNLLLPTLSSSLILKYPYICTHCILICFKTFKLPFEFLKIPKLFWNVLPITNCLLVFYQCSWESCVVSFRFLIY